MNSRRQRPNPTGCRFELLETILRCEEGDLIRFAGQHCTHQDDAVEAVSEACERYVRSFDGAGIESARLWLYFVVRRRAWSLSKRRQSRPVLPGSIDDLDLIDPAPGPEELAVLRLEATEFAAAFRRLRVDERRALELQAIGYTYQEIALSTGWSRRKTDRLLSEGRGRLRVFLGEGG